MDNVIEKIIEIDKEAKVIVEAVREKNENIENVIRQELVAKECALEAHYQEVLEGKKKEYEKKFEEEKVRQQYLTNMKLEQKAREFERQKEQMVEKLFEDIIKKVEVC